MGVRATYLAIVTNVLDPEQRGRVKVKCPDLSGNHEIYEWLAPRPVFGGKKGSGTGMFFVPDVGATVELEVEHDPDGLLLAEGSGLPRAAYRAVLLAREEKVPAPLRPEVGGTPCYPRVAGFTFPDGSYLTFNYHEKGRVMTAVMGAARLALDELNKVALLEDDAEVRLRATDGAGQVVLEAAKVFLGSDSATEEAVLGTTYRSSEDSVFSLLQTLCDQLNVLCTALAAEPYLIASKASAPLTAAAAVAASTGITAFDTNKSLYVSPKVKLE